MIASVMISSSEMGYLFILMMKTAHVLFQNKNKTIKTSVDKGSPQQKEKM